MATAPKNKRINVAVTEDVKIRVLNLAERKAMNESDIVRAALNYYLNREEKR